MTVQVNARIPDEIGSALDRWSSELGVQRSDLIRQVLTEAVEAHREGRARFERPETPGPADLQRLATKLDEQTTELDRVLRQNAKRDADLARQAREDTRGVSAARDAIAADVVSQLRAALEVLHGELVRTREDLSALMQRLPQLLAIDTRLDRIEELAAKPRNKTVNNFGLGEWTWPAFAAIGTILLAIGMFAFLAIAAVLPERWLELKYANKMLGGGDRAICRLIDFHYETGLTDCRIKNAGGTVTITSTLSRTSQRNPR